jgi:hypothetical protein
LVLGLFDDIIQGQQEWAAPKFKRFDEGLTMRGLVIGVLVFAMFSVCWAAPQPAVVQKSGDWTLDLRFENPQQITLEGATPQRYWYTILTLTNKLGKDVDFYPAAQLITDTLQVVPAIKGTSAVLFEKIKNRHQGKYPFLQLLENTGDKILQGQDNTVDIAVIWPDFDPNAKSVSIFITGLSNETVAVDHPADKDKDGNPVKVYLRKTLQLNYSIAGDPKFRADQKLKFENKTWVMR